MENLIKISQKYVGKTPKDMGCETWTDLENKLEEELRNYYANQKQPISAERKQELFNYFYDNHDFRLLESDYEEIEAIYGGFKQPTPTDEEIEEEAKTYNHSMASMAEAMWMPRGFIEGAKWLRDTYQPTEQQNWILEELQSIRNYMQARDAYHGYGQMDDLIKKLETPSK